MPSQQGYRREPFFIRAAGSWEKIPWHGVLTSVQPRIRLDRSFDQRSHTYLGYALRVRGNMGSEAREFLVGVGESAQAKHQFHVGATISGEAVPVADPRLEIVEFYKVSNLKVAVRRLRKRHRHHRGVVLHRRFRSTANAVTGDWRHGPTRRSAPPACGDAKWRWR